MEPRTCRCLREARLEAGLTQKELAHRLGISQAAISKMERQNNATLDTLKRLREALGLNSIVELLKHCKC